MRAGLAVVAGASGPSSAIPPSTATCPGPGVERGEVIERRAHRDRVGVVAVVDEHRPPPAARSARPAGARRISPAPDAPSRDERVERHADRDRAGALARLCASVNGSSKSPRRRESRSAPPSARAAAPTSANTSPPGPKVIVTSGRAGAARAPRRRRGPRRAPASPSPARISAFASAIASSVPSSSRWTGPTLVIAATSGSAISHSSAIWPSAPHRHLEHQHLGLGRRDEHRQRQADLGVEVLGAGVDAQRAGARGRCP